MRAPVIPALQMPIMAKPPIIKGLLPSLSMEKHCRRRHCEFRCKNIQETSVSFNVSAGATRSHGSLGNSPKMFD